MELPGEIRELRERRVLRIEKSGRTYEVMPSDGERALRGARSRIILVIHGYNNTERAANVSYEALYNQLARLRDGRSLDTPLLQDVWEVYWPGYWPHPFDGVLASSTSYSWKVAAAPKIGETIADYLKKLNGDREILFVAHSLGCRVVLETIKNMLGEKRFTFPGICLMAAAVPTFMFDDKGDLRLAANCVNRRYILHSRADFVLHWFFRPGQAPLDRRLPEAVGRFGNPRSYWDTRHENVVETNLGHSDYYKGFKKGEGACQSRTSPTIARLFGRCLPMYPRESDPYVVKWELPSQPPPLSRTVGVANSAAT